MMGANATGPRTQGLPEGIGGAALLSGTTLRTLDGLLPVDYLSPGDRIVCRQGARRLVGVFSTLLHATTLVRIRASTLGHDRPDQDLLVTPDTGVIIRDWRAKLLYGSAAAVIPAARLVDGEFVVTETHAEARLYTLTFAEDEVIYAEGLELSCPALVPALPL